MRDITVTVKSFGILFKFPFSYNYDVTSIYIYTIPNYIFILFVNHNKMIKRIKFLDNIIDF